MKLKFTVLLLGCLAMASCNPSKTIFIRNQTERPIKVILSHPENNSFFTGRQSILYLGTSKPASDSIINYGEGNRWSKAQEQELASIFNRSVIIFTDRGDTLQQKNIKVENINIAVKELYLQIKK
jgi:hypothetical protein